MTLNTAIDRPRYAALVHSACPNLEFLAVTADVAGTPADEPPPSAWVQPDLVPFESLLGTVDASAPYPVEPLRNLGVQFTSGTTSRPKTVLWTHANALWAGRVSAAHLPDVGRRFGVDVIGWWGMTETLTHGIVTESDHPGPRGVRGVTLFKEYYGNRPANDKVFDADGWFDTGDNVRMDADGWLFFSDRSKDVLKVGAENVAASEIESVIMQTGLVEECAVVALLRFRQ